MSDTATSRCDGELGRVQELVLRTLVSVAVKPKRAAGGCAVDRLDEPLEDVPTIWKCQWLERETLNDGVFERRENDVTRESNRVSVSRAVHSLVDRALLDAQIPATAIKEDGALRLSHYGDPTASREKGSSSPTYTLVRVSNKGERLIHSLRTGERNKWDRAIYGNRGGGGA